MKLYSQSQLGQDMSVANFFQSRHNGYFVDVGAWDGYQISNTYMLEKQLNWTGICVEPLPDQFAILQSQRDCICVQAAAYSESGLELDFAIADGLSGIVQHINKHMQVLENDRIKVQTRTLTDIMDEHGAPLFIEYLSIDTEGSEVEVLCGIDWNRYSFGYITIEHNEVATHRKTIRDFWNPTTTNFYEKIVSMMISFTYEN